MATYNCADSIDNAYGSGSFGNCTGQSVGAPNTGVFDSLASNGTFTIIAPLVVAVLVVVIASVVIRRRKKAPSNDASL